MAKKTQKPQQPSDARSFVAGRPVRDLPVATFPGWDSVTSVRGALVQLEQGKFELAAMLLDAMEQDDRVKGTTAARYDGLLGLPLEMRPPTGEEDNPKALEIAEACDKAWSKMAPTSELRDMLRFGRGLGFVSVEKVWEYGDVWLPRIKVHHPRFAYWTWGIGPEAEGMGSFRGFNLITQDGVVMLDLRDPAVRRNWALYTPFGFQRGWAKALIKSLAIPWLARTWALRDWARYSEVHGMPIRVGEVPTDAAQEDKDRFIRELASLANESTIRAPREQDGTGFAVKLVEAAALGWEAFKGLREEASDSISVAVLGQTLTTAVKGGSYAAAKIHDTVRQDIIASDAGTMSETLRSGLLVDFVEVNFGPKFVDLTPWPTWPIDPPQDLGSRATAFKTFGEGLASLRATQLPIDIAELCERFEVPLIDGAEIPDYEPPPPPVLPAAPGDKPPDDAPPDEKPAAGGKDEAKLSAAFSRRKRSAIQGQVYVDEVADNARAEAARLLAGDLRAVKGLVAEAQGYEELRQKLVAQYRGMSPAKLARLVEKALILAELSGRYAVQKESA